MNQNDEQPDPRIVQALEENSEVLDNVASAILGEGLNLRDAIETSLAQGFALGMEAVLDGSSPTPVTVNDAPLSLVKTLLKQVDQYLLDVPAAQQMLSELRKPLAGYLQHRIAQTRKSFIAGLATTYGEKLAQMVVDGEELTDEQRMTIAVRELTAPMGVADFLAFATQYRKMPKDKCRCLGCQRQAFNLSSLNMEQARAEAEKEWPDQHALLLAFGQDRQDVWVHTVKRVTEEGGGGTEHFGVDRAPDPEAAQGIVKDALKRLGIQDKKE